MIFGDIIGIIIGRGKRVCGASWSFDISKPVRIILSLVGILTITRPNAPIPASPAGNYIPKVTESPYMSLNSGRGYQTRMNAILREAMLQSVS
jgi:hypothetical protein